jgi:SulP family sulfate permease
MKDSATSRYGAMWRVPPARWLAEYRAAWLRGDIFAGFTVAAYAIPVSLAYAGLAGLPPQVGVYGYLLGGLGYALLGSSRQLAIGPTSAISLMIAGTVGEMAGGDAQHYAQIASLAGFTVAMLCVIAWRCCPVNRRRHRAWSPHAWRARYGTYSRRPARPGRPCPEAA